LGPDEQLTEELTAQGDSSSLLAIIGWLSRIVAAPSVGIMLIRRHKETRGSTVSVLGRGPTHINVGSEIEIPNNKIRWDRGNPRPRHRVL